MTENLSRIYKEHHQFYREPGFSILKAERGEILRKIIGRGKFVLDIGCRDGALTKYFLEGNRIFGIDIDETALNKARELGIETLLMDLVGGWQELNGRKFDAVVAGEVLEHLYYPEKVIEKVARHLNTDGVFVGSVPNAFSLKNRLRYFMGTKKYTPLSDPTHINHFHVDELKQMLQKYFIGVEIMGLGRYKRLAKMFPNYFSFDLLFIAKK